MEIQFRRTGERRYAVTILISGQSVLEMNPAPGYDPRMPHDLLHLVVESELGLRHGIFGQISAGGNAGTFHPVPSHHEGHREASRRRRGIAKRGEKLLREGRREAAVSEHATYICLSEWLARTAQPQRRKQPGRRSTRPVPPANDRPTAAEALTEDRLNRICDRLDKLSAEWMRLEIGGALTVIWPD